MAKLQFLVLIFAVLWSKLCNVLLCNYKIYLSSFSILKIAAFRDIRLSKISNLNCTSGAGYQNASITMPNFTKIGQKVAEIWRFNGFQNGGCPPSWVCEIQIFSRCSGEETHFALSYQIS